MTLSYPYPGVDIEPRDEWHGLYVYVCEICRAPLLLTHGGYVWGCDCHCQVTDDELERLR